MPEKKKPKVIILENNTIVLEHARSVLAGQGWDVTCEKVSKKALHTLAQSKKSLFALFISNFKLPKMEGDDILQKVKSISPLTQRMLLVPSDHPETLISAINKAEIHASIISPFNDEELIDQAQHRLKHFKHELKRQQLKRVTEHQNQQMLKIAQKLKKKDEKYKIIINEKKVKKLKLESKNKKISLSGYIKKRELDPSPDAFQKEFILICNTIKDLFDQITDKHETDPLSINLKEILSPDKDEKIDRNKELYNSKKTESGSIKLRQDIIKTALINAINSNSTSSSSEEDEIIAEKTDNIYDDYIEISISKDQTLAYIKKKKALGSDISEYSLSNIHEMLSQKQVLNGLINDEAIEAWISNPSTEKIIIAKGKKPIQGIDGEVK